jgi:hypothetical protein
MDDRDEIMRKAYFNVSAGRDQDEREHARWLTEHGDQPMVWDPANPKGFRSTAGMSNAEFDAYCRAGKPPLDKPKARAIETSRRREVLPELVTKELLYKICGMIGAEVGKVEARLTDKMDPLNDENPFPFEPFERDNVVELPGSPKRWRNVA